jgi:hypothetical protein
VLRRVPDDGLVECECDVSDDGRRTLPNMLSAGEASNAMQCSVIRERKRSSAGAHRRERRDESRNRARHLAVPDDDVHAAGIWAATGACDQGGSLRRPRQGSPMSAPQIARKIPAQLPCSRAAEGLRLQRWTLRAGTAWRRARPQCADGRRSCQMRQMRRGTVLQRARVLVTRGALPWNRFSVSWAGRAARNTERG